MDSKPRSCSSARKRAGIALSGALILALSVQCSPEAADDPADMALANIPEEIPLPPVDVPNVAEPPAPPPRPVAIDQGVVEIFSSEPRVAPLRITTPPGEISYFVKLVDADTTAPIMTLFIRGGQTFETEVPLGRTRVRYASGLVWQGPQSLFGPETNYQEADQTLDFAEEADGVAGYSIDLIPQIGGNLASRSLAGNEF